MRFKFFLVTILAAALSMPLPSAATEFTLASYNCGALSNHYDHIRAVAMQKLMQERFNAESAEMALY